MPAVCTYTFLLAMLTASSAFPQTSLRIFSEFKRVDLTGDVVEPDRKGKSREILSPAFARNASHTLRIVSFVPAGKNYTLHISQNPDDAVQVRLYRERPSGYTIPDALEPAKLPVQGTGGNYEVFLLDVRVPPLAPVRRIRLEAQIFDGETWTIYPMEVRIIAAIAPDWKPSPGPLPEISQPSDTAARRALRSYVCGSGGLPGANTSSTRGIIGRNLQQDIALARALQNSIDPQNLKSALVQAAGALDTESWCAAKSWTSPLGPEWYLRVRDLLYREASR